MAERSGAAAQTVEYPLAETIHDLPHLNLSFKPILRSNFNVTNPQYIQSLEVFCLYGLFLGLGLLILFGFVQCFCGCWKLRNGMYAYSYRMRQRSTVLTFFISLTAGIAMICCVGSCYFGAVAVQGSMHRIYEHLSNITLSIDEYNSLMDDIEGNVWTISNQSAVVLPSSKLKDKFAEVIAEIERDKIPDFSPDLHRFVIFNLTREIITAVLTATQFVFCAALLTAVFYKKTKVFFLQCLLILLTVCLFLVCISAGIYTSLAVASADICVEHTMFLRYMMVMQGVADDVIQLFMKCEDPNLAIPDMRLLDLTDGVLSVLNFALAVWGKRVVPELTANVAQLTAETEKLRDLMSCKKLTQSDGSDILIQQPDLGPSFHLLLQLLTRIIQDYKGIVGIVCQPLLQGLLSFCIASSAGAVLVWILINQLKPYIDRLEMWMKMEGIKQRADSDENDEEREQLLSGLLSQEQLLSGQLSEEFRNYAPPAYGSNLTTGDRSLYYSLGNNAHS